MEKELVMSSKIVKMVCGENGKAPERQDFSKPKYKRNSPRSLEPLSNGRETSCRLV